MTKFVFKFFFKFFFKLFFFAYLLLSRGVVMLSSSTVQASVSVWGHRAGGTVPAVPIIKLYNFKKLLTVSPSIDVTVSLMAPFYLEPLLMIPTVPFPALGKYKGSLTADTEPYYFLRRFLSEPMWQESESLTILVPTVQILQVYGTNISDHILTENNIPVPSEERILNKVLNVINFFSEHGSCPKKLNIFNYFFKVPRLLQTVPTLTYKIFADSVLYLGGRKTIDDNNFITDASHQPTDSSINDKFFLEPGAQPIARRDVNIKSFFPDSWQQLNSPDKINMECRDQLTFKIYCYGTMVQSIFCSKIHNYLCRIHIMEGQLLKDYEELMEIAAGGEVGTNTAEGQGGEGNGDDGDGDDGGTSLAGYSSLVGSQEQGGSANNTTRVNNLNILDSTAPPPPAATNARTTTGTILGGSTSSDTNTANMELEGNCIGPIYQRCKSARATGLQINSTSTSPGTNIGNTTLLTENRVGSLDNGDEFLAKTFRGSRITSNGVIVNQNVSMSFDPATLTCLVCTVPHHIVPRDGSGLVLVLGDQNFSSSIVGKNHCVPVVRVEDASLKELVSMGMEILDRCSLPQITHFLVGTVSYLAKVGTTLYSLEWQSLVREFGSRWFQATVGPLPPILRDQTAPGVCRQLSELKSWFDKVYIGNLSYQSTTWNTLMELLSNPPDTGIDLGRDDVYTVALPVNLADSHLVPVKFHVSSCHAATSTFGGKAIDELTCALLEQLNNSFSCNAHPDDYVAREPAESGGAENRPSSPKTVLFLGGSHCRRLSGEFQRLGYTVIDKTTPGWQPSDSSIKTLEDDIQSLGNLQGVTVICDLMSNITYRYTQLDGQLLLPVKLNGCYHILGEVTTATRELLVTILKKLRRLLDQLPGNKVVISPLPRYLYTACCTDPTHCTGIGEPGHARDLITKVGKVRKTIREHLTSVHSNLYVPDFLTLMLPGCDGPAQLAEGVGNLTGDDGVHLTREGYTVLADTIHQYLCNKIAAVSLVSGRAAGEKPAVFYWRGISSPVGAARPDRRGSFHDNRAAGGKMRAVLFGQGNRGGRSYPPGGKRWN